MSPPDAPTGGKSRSADLSEAEIAVHWKEEAGYAPPPDFVRQANLTDPGVTERFGPAHFPECFREYADLLTWDAPWHTTLDSRRAPFYEWFVGGRLNATTNCLDRHLPKFRNKAAFIFVPESETEPTVVLTYQDLWVRVNELAVLLEEFAGLRTGDRITVHLPMTPELPITMLACARLGLVHSVVFAGFSGEACGRRIADSGSRVLVTMDTYARHGSAVDHKPAADVAVEVAEKEGRRVEKVLVWKRHPPEYRSVSPVVSGRDYLIDDLLPQYSGRRAEPVSLLAEAPFFLMYTSGTTGRPKGIQHGLGGYLAYVAGTARSILDIHPEDVYWCLADIGWITGHSYIVYGPLALAATSVIYEGVPVYPDAGRPWRISERLGVNIFHTSPTAIRMLRKLGPHEPRKYRTAFKHLTTVGEPIEPEAWRWYFEEVGKGKAVVVDTWWQTETGGVLCATKPALDQMKPGSAGPGVPGIYPVVLDDNGEEIPAGSQRAGNLCIRNPWPGLMQTIWGDPGRYVETYFEKYHRDSNSHDWRDWPYRTGDGALIAADGYLRILGRLDDVINVAGHRLGTKEIESACLTCPAVAEAAVVPVVDEIKGRVPEVYVSLKPGYSAGPEVEEEVRRAIETEIGKIARPRAVRIVPDMPKTRSGKILRRVLAAISNGMEPGDVSTLANPDVVDQIRSVVPASGRTSPSAPPRDLEEFGTEG